MTVYQAANVLFRTTNPSTFVFDVSNEFEDFYSGFGWQSTDPVTNVFKAYAIKKKRLAIKLLKNTKVALPF